MSVTSVSILFYFFSPIFYNPEFRDSTVQSEDFIFSSAPAAPNWWFVDGDTSQLKYPFEDKKYDASTPLAESPLFLSTNGSVDTKYEMSPDGKGFYIYEQVGNEQIRPPSYMPMDQFREYMEQKKDAEYLNLLSQSDNGSSLDNKVPPINVNSGLFKDIFGSGSVQIIPNGSALLTFGGRVNRNRNPSLTIQQQKNFQFVFDQQIQFNVVGKIGEKLQLKVNWNTQANFDFENQFKIDYTGTEDEIIQKIDAGNVSLPLQGSLITGAQNLFGIKMALKFGPLLVTTVASQQRGKQNTITIKGGSQLTEFNKKIDDYDEWRHFFLSHYFRSQYESALSNLPALRPKIRINNIQVWVTNPNNASTANLRSAAGFVDLGENSPASNGKIYNPIVAAPNTSYTNPDNRANSLYTTIIGTTSGSTPRNRNDLIYRDNAVAASRLNIRPGQDFEVTDNMKMLNENTDFRINRELGYISLNTKLNNNEVLYVAYDYTLIGDPSNTVYKVGEFSQDVPANIQNPNLLFLKLLKRSSVNPVDDQSRQYPAWDLMMKNIYNIGGYNLKPDNFRLDVFFQSTGGAGDINYLPSGAVKNIPLIQVTLLDQLRNNSELGADNLFDFLDKKTVDAEKGLIIFPVLEPFGSHLATKLQNNPRDINQFVFSTLYSRTRADAIAFSPQVNRYFLKGSYRSAVGQEIMLNATNLSPGSVKVSAGGAQLTEGTDFTVNYQAGRVSITNPGVLSSNQDIKITFESQTLFNMQPKTMVGSRFDLTLTKHLKIGGTIMHLNERPITQKILLGDEPISNTIWGTDIAWKADSKFLTDALDKLPLLSTKEVSSLTFAGEFAQLIPGLPRQVKTDKEKGISYLDDFESTKSVQDYSSPYQWHLASFPTGSDVVRPSGSDLAPNFNRAKLAWYRIDPSFYNTPKDYFSDTRKLEVLSDHYQRQIAPKEVFPNLTPTAGSNLLLDFILHYMPTERGPYNYNANPGDINPANGKFIRPEENWAGIQRQTSGNTDFEASNVEFIEFWVMDPFKKNPQAVSSGELVINLGKVSEDVIPDGFRNFENGLPADGSDSNTDTSAWGRTPTVNPPTSNFDNNPDARKFQDVGLDGVNNDKERDVFFRNFLDQMNSLSGGNSNVMDALNNDPSTDNFKFFTDYPTDSSITHRYRNFNGYENNSPVPQGGGSNGVPSNYQFPDNEDINRSGTLNNIEEYYEYKVKMNPSDLTVGRNYVVDKIQSQVKLINDVTETITWYQFRVPLTSGRPINGIQNFKSVDYIRMYMKGFSEEIILRFAKFQLVATQWRAYRGNVGDDGEVIISDPSNDPSFFESATVNIEENSSKSPVNYVIPPGINRQNNPGDPTTNTQLNEQALVLRTCNLPDGEGRAVFKNVSFDFRSYTRLKMFVHAEAAAAPAISNITNTGDIKTFMRIGSDYLQNYYEYEIPLKPTPQGQYNPSADIESPPRYDVWPTENAFDISLEDLTKLKSERNAKLNTGQIGLTDKYSIVNSSGHRISIIGNPQLNNVKNIMVGIRNPKDGNGPICGEIWINELRVTDFFQQNGWAANARLNLKLADFGNITLSGAHSTPGFGSLESKMNDRNRFFATSYATQGTFEMGKFTPKNWGLQIPVYLTYGESFKDFEFSPLDPDVVFTQSLEAIPQKETRDSIKRAYQDYQLSRGYSFNQVRKQRMNPNKKTRLYQIENFAFTYGYNEQFQRSHLIEKQLNQTWNAAVDYNYTFRNKPVKPFKSKKADGPKNLLREFNFNYLPKSIGVNITGNRQFEERQFRSTANTAPVAPNYTTNFLVNRNYNLRWDLAQSLGLTYTAANVARVDEPYGKIDTPEKKDTVMKNLFSVGKDSANSRFRTINFGRNLNFNQSVALTYKLPFEKIRSLNFISSQVSYTSTFKWETAQLQNQSLGNTIGNSRTITASPSINLANLYKKFPKIQKALDPKKPLSVLADTLPHRFGAIKAVGKELLRIILSMKTFDLNIQDNRSTILPGYIPQTDNFGLDFGYTPPDSFGSEFPKGIPPGIPFILGSQKDIRPQAGRSGWISRDPALASLFSQTKSQNITGKTGFVLFQDLKVDLSANRTTTENRSSVFSYNTQAGQYVTSSENITGSYSISYIAINSHFGKVDSTSAVFDRFSENRKIISKRLANNNPNYSSLNPRYETAGDYFSGYDGSQQDVLIPSFLSAYGPGNVNLIGLTAMPPIPLPNWNMTYSGLSKLPGMKKLFNTITLTHAYRCTYAVGNWVKNLSATDVDKDGYAQESIDLPDATDKSGNLRRMFNFQPLKTINTISLQEQFSPFLGMNFIWKSGLTTGLDYNRDRTLSFNIGNKQLTEGKTRDVSVNIGYRKDKLNQSIRLFGKVINLKNQLNAVCRISIRSTKTHNRTLDLEGPDPVTQGTTTINIAPSVDYTISKRLNVRAFLEHSINRPSVASSFPTSFTNFGIQLRFSLTG